MLQDSKDVCILQEDINIWTGYKSASIVLMEGRGAVHHNWDYDPGQAWTGALLGFTKLQVTKLKRMLWSGTEKDLDSEVGICSYKATEKLNMMRKGSEEVTDLNSALSEISASLKPILSSCQTILIDGKFSLVA